MWLEWQLSFIGNNQKKITGYRSRSLILDRSDHLLCFIRYGLSLWRNMNALLFLVVACTRAESTGTCRWRALVSIRLSGRRASVARFLVKRRRFCKDTFENLGSLTIFEEHNSVVIFAKCGVTLQKNVYLDDFLIYRNLLQAFSFEEDFKVSFYSLFVKSYERNKNM